MRMLFQKLFSSILQSVRCLRVVAFFKHYHYYKVFIVFVGWVCILTIAQRLEVDLVSSDEFELKFPELSRAKLGRLRAEPSLGI